VSTLTLRPLARTDLALLAGWLREEHVQRWWKDPTAPDNVEKDYLPCILGTDPTEVLVIEWEGRDIGMVQRYRLVDNPEYVAALAPSGVDLGAAAGIDYVIGAPDMIGRGIGSRLIETFSAEVFDRYPDIDRIVVNPQAANGASCRVLDKAGYRLAWTGMIESEDPSDAGPIALYILDRKVFEDRPVAS
jgi:aminoglycoside 6'-N-acetyltransferase